MADKKIAIDFILLPFACFVVGVIVGYLISFV